MIISIKQNILLKDFMTVTFLPYRWAMFELLLIWRQDVITSRYIYFIYQGCFLDVIPVLIKKKINLTPEN